MFFKLSIVIPVFNKFNFTKACLEDLFKLPDDHQIIIVDNGSSDETVSLANLKKDNFIYHRNDKNRGFVYASNKGYALSSGSLVMFLNNDVRVQRNHSDWTQPIIDILDKNKRTIVSPTIGILDDQFNFIKETTYTGSDKDASFPPKQKNWYMSGWNLTARREDWKELTLPDDEGPFSTEFWSYFEDTDLSFRAKELNFNFKPCSVPVIHFGRVTSSSIGLSQMYTVSRSTFLKKWSNK